MLGRFSGYRRRRYAGCREIYHGQLEEQPGRREPCFDSEKCSRKCGKARRKKIRTAPREGRFLLGEKKEKEEMNEKVKK